MILTFLSPGKEEQHVVRDRVHPVSLELKIVLWIEMVVYLGIGHLIRPEVLLLCVGLNLWGIVVYLFHTRKTMIVPFTYLAFREDCVDAEGERVALRLDRMAGYERRAAPKESPS